MVLILKWGPGVIFTNSYHTYPYSYEDILSELHSRLQRDLSYQFPNQTTKDFSIISLIAAGHLTTIFTSDLLIGMQYNYDRLWIPCTLGYASVIWNV